MGWYEEHQNDNANPNNTDGKENNEERTVDSKGEPLLHNSGIPSYDAILPIRPFYKEGEQGKKPQKEKKPCLLYTSRCV